MRHPRPLPSLLACLLLVGVAVPAVAAPTVPAIAIGTGLDPATGVLADRRTVFRPGERYDLCATFAAPAGAATLTLWIGAMERPDLGSVLATDTVAVDPDARTYCTRGRRAPDRAGTFEVRLYRDAELLAAGRFAVADVLPDPVLRLPAVTPPPVPAGDVAGDGTTLCFRLLGEPVEIALYTGSAPAHAAVLVALAQQGYLGTTSVGWAYAVGVVRAGLPGDAPPPVWTVPPETDAPGRLLPGTVFVDATDDPEGARFYVVTSRQVALAVGDDVPITIVGRVTVGMEVIARIAASPADARGVLARPVRMEAVEVLMRAPPGPDAEPAPDARAAELLARIPRTVAGVELTRAVGSGAELGIAGPELVAIGYAHRDGVRLSVMAVVTTGLEIDITAIGTAVDPDATWIAIGGRRVFHVVAGARHQWFWEQDGLLWGAEGPPAWVEALMPVLDAAAVPGGST